MGAYLSTPVTEKISVNKETNKLKYGASSMQGWRVAQEDAHNCCPDYDDDTSLFAVYDGHGGSEVAAYTAANLPAFLKSLSSYKEGKMTQALEHAFLGFDEKLTRPEVIKELKELAGLQSDDNKEDPDEDEEPGLLMKEASMPLEQLLEKYGGPASGTVRNLRKQDKFNSPVIKPKTELPNTTKAEPETTVTSDPVRKSLSEELINGVSENENNENKEKEQAQSIANSCTDSKSEISNTAECTNTTPNGSDRDTKPPKETEAAMMPDSSTDTCKPKRESVCSGSNVDDGVSSGSSCNNTSEAVCSSSSSGGSSGSSSADVGSSSGSGSSAGISYAGSSSAGSSACEAGSSDSAGSSSKTQPGGSSSNVEVSPCGSSSKVEEGGSSSKTEDNASSVRAEAGGSSSTSEAGGSSTEQGAEAGSSTGRTRTSGDLKLSADGEDSTDDSDDSDVELDSDEDIDALVEPDSEDDSDEMEEGEEDDDDCEEEDDILGGPEEPGSESGTTAVVALIRGKDLHVANAGDSRCVLCRAGKAVDMSDDHKPEDDIEQARIMTAGGRVTPDGRVNGGLNLSRALGDHCYKRNESLPLRDQMITPLPDIKSVVLDDQDEFMVLACDGIWNVMTSQDVTNFVRERIQSGVKQMSVICEEMFDFCLAPDTNGDGTGCDNMTCIIIKFNFDTNKHQTASVKRQHSDSTDPETAKKTKTDS